MNVRAHLVDTNRTGDGIVARFGIGRKFAWASDRGLLIVDRWRAMMSPKPVVPLSRRADIVAEMRRILSARRSRANWRSEFLTAVLRSLGIRSSIPTSVDALLVRVPTHRVELEGLDMGNLLDAIERAGLFVWRHDSTVVVNVGVRDALCELCVRVLSSPSRTSMPQPVARELAEAMRAAARPHFDHLELYALLERELLRRMWKCRGSERPLAMRLVRIVAAAAGLRFER